MSDFSTHLIAIPALLTAGLALPSSSYALDNNVIGGSRHTTKVFERVVNTNLTSKGSNAKMTAIEIAGALSGRLPSGVSLSGGEGYRLDLSAGAATTAHSYIDGFKVCGSTIKSVALGTANYLVGHVPATAPRSSFSASDFIGPTAVADAVAARFPGRDVTMDSQAPCLYPLAAGDFRPAYYVWFAVDGRQHYRGYHDGDEFFELHQAAFDVDGTARIYASNPKAGTIQAFDLLGITDSGRLTNKYFITRMDPDRDSSLASATRVFVANNEFHFEGNTSSSAFMETSIFTNANRILGFFASIGYDSFGPDRIVLNLHPRVKANAQYLPKGSGGPMISIGDGEPGLLENLTLDMDVVNHEFGHHVVFGSLKDISTFIDGTRQVLVMHEALADYFSFAFSGDSCLGESICPSGSRLCALANQCLRTASNDMTMTSGSSDTEEHVRGQFMSGFLWDIRSDGSVNATTFDRTVLKAVELLSSNSGYQDMLLNVYTADRETNSGAYCARIKQSADKRELSRYLNYNCATGEFQKLVAGDSQSQSTSSSSSRSSGLFSFCGTIKGHKTPGVSWLYLLAGILPMLWLGRRREERS